MVMMKQESASTPFLKLDFAIATMATLFFIGHYSSSFTILLIYVDDILINGSDSVRLDDILNVRNPLLIWRSSN